MVCVPCIVIPVLLWVFHKYIQPFILKFWNPWGSKSINDTQDGIPQGIDQETAEFQYIQKQIKEHAVIMFSKTTCSFCKMAKEVLDGINVDYIVEEIDLREDCNELQDIFLKLTGARSVPRVFVGQKCIGGGSETWSLHNQGKLLPLIKEAGGTFKNSDKKTD